MLKIENLSVAVQGRQILHDINLHIKPGEVHVLFGPNGTGKSTLIGTIMGFERYEVLSGKIYFKGHDITEAPCYERARLGVGVMIQRPPTIRGLSLRHMIEICGATPQETEQMARWMGLADFLDRSVNEGFSGGELKRSELLQLMAQKPELLLLDEPESGVDVENIALVGRAANYILHNEPCGGTDSDKISLFLLQCSFSSIFISICLHGIPPVFFDKFRIFFSGGAGIHQFQRQLRLYFGLNRRIVDLNKAGAAILPLQIDTNMLQPFFPCC